MLRFCIIFVIFVTTSASECFDELHWSTAKSRIIVNNQSLVLKGVNYHGFESNTFAPHGIWREDLNDFLDFIKNNDFNAIRVPFSLEMIRDNPTTNSIDCGKNPGLCNVTAIRLLDFFIERCAERGLLIALSNHRFSGRAYSKSPTLWYNSEYSEEQVISLWRTVVLRYKKHWNVFAIDLKNQPHDEATWGDSNAKTDWNKAAERMINKLGDFRGLFFVNGVEWGNQLANAAQFPIDTGNATLNNRVIYAPHCYGPGVYDADYFKAPGFPVNLDAVYMAKYGFLLEKGYTVVIGEWGGNAVPGTFDAKWNDWFVEWLRSKCLSNNFYWCLNPNSKYTGGLLEDDWRTPVKRKLDLVNRLQPTPTKFMEQDGKICIIRGVFSDKACNEG